MYQFFYLLISSSSSSSTNFTATQVSKQNFRAAVYIFTLLDMLVADESSVNITCFVISHL